MAPVKIDRTLDARGLSCPMPLVKARKEVNELQPGQVLEVLSTDRGSVKDFQGWASAAPTVELLAQETRTEDGKEIYVHYLSKKA